MTEAPIVHLTVSDCATICDNALAWWRRHSPQPASLNGNFVALALLRHELEDLCAGRNASPDAPPRRRAPRPWNVNTDGRLLAFVRRHISCVVQPPLIVSCLRSDGRWVLPAPGDPHTGFDGLARALGDIASVPRRHGMQVHALVYLDLDRFPQEPSRQRNALRKAPRRPYLPERRDVAIQFVRDLAHAIEVSHTRIDRLVSYRDDRAWRYKISGEAEYELTKFRTLLAAPEAVSGLARQERCFSVQDSATDTLYACFVYGPSPAVPRQLTILWTGAFTIRNTMQRLKTLFGRSFDRAGFHFDVKARSRCATALPFPWIEAVAATTGDCQPERDLLKAALSASIDPDTQSFRKDTIIALVRLDDPQWDLKAPAEMRFVLDVWSRWSRDPAGRNARKRQRRRVLAISKKKTALHGKKGIRLDNQEYARPRLPRERPDRPPLPTRALWRSFIPETPGAPSAP